MWEAGRAAAAVLPRGRRALRPRRPARSIERLEDVPELDGYVHVDWKAMDEWFEEDELAIGHVRDPYHRLDARHTSRHVRVLIDGETRRGLHADGRAVRDRPAHALVLPARGRANGPARSQRREDDLRVQGPRRPPVAPGRAEHRLDLRRGGPEVAPVEGLICFYDEWVDVEIDGERQERPETPFQRLAAPGPR